MEKEKREKKKKTRENKKVRIYIYKVKQRFHWPSVNWFALGSSLSFASVGIDTFIVRVGFVKTRNGSVSVQLCARWNTL